MQIEPKVYLRLVLLEKYVETEDIYLLNHEIGHYLLGCICVLEFKHKVKDWKFDLIQYEKEITDLFNQTVEKYVMLNDLYD